MKTIIAGSRLFRDPDTFQDAIAQSGFAITEIVTTGEPGTATLGSDWAKQNRIPITEFPLDTSKYGEQAWSHRNSDMADHSDAIIALWDIESVELVNLVRRSRVRGLHVFVWRYNEEGCEPLRYGTLFMSP